MNIKQIFLATLLLVTAFVCFGQNNFVIPRASGANFPSNVRPVPTYVNARVLAANVAETTTLPAGTRIVIFSADCNFYASAVTSASIPADVTGGNASELNPSAWYFPNTATQTQAISVISAVPCTVTFSAYTNTNLQ
jgi:hypothetical protein